MKFELDLRANVPCEAVSIAVLFDDKKIFESKAQNLTQTISAELPEEAGNHVIKLIMQGKTSRHTKVNDQGQIIDDVYFQIDRLEFEGIDVTQIFCQGRQCYTHSFNQRQPAILDEFYGFIGCNGVIEIEFSTPIFLWMSDYLL